VPERPFHHGNLRAELLERAEIMLRQRGVDELSLRELAREAGVSHGAPRTHFVDRRALLDALAVRGFERLSASMQVSGSSEPDDHIAGLTASAHAYVDFATVDAALLEVMWSAVKEGDAAPEVLVAVGQFFATVEAQVAAGIASGSLVGHDVERLTLLISATMQGIGAFASAGRTTSEQNDALIDDAIAGWSA
jgi:AcrR family transcriptional regulator